MARLPRWVIEKLCVPNGAPVPAGAPVGADDIIRGPSADRGGKRDTTLASMAGHMRRAGFNEVEIYTALAKVNEGRCDPPLAESDVRRIARSVSRYEPDPLANVTITGVTREAGNGAGPVASPAPDPFPDPIIASNLKRAAAAKWLWHGYLARGSITLLTALWKSGKTTLLAHLLRAFGTLDHFCGQAIVPARVLYITEESETRWTDRRDEIGIGDHVEFIIRPFRGKPSWDRWGAFIDHLAGLCKSREYDLVVMDTLSNLWPVREENNAPEVQTALMPLHQLGDRAGVGLVHHNRKGDGTEATAARGSGALPAFVDTIIEFRRYAAADRKDRRRVLTGYGRYDETPEEMVVTLTDDCYIAEGSKHEVSSRDLVSIIRNLLPGHPPGWTQTEIEKAWPGKVKPANHRLIDALHQGVDTGVWERTGDGKRGDPYRFWKASV